MLKLVFMVEMLCRQTYFNYRRFFRNCLPQSSSECAYRHPFNDLVHSGDAVATLDSELDEAIVAPSSAPRVLDQPVLSSDLLSSSLSCFDEGTVTAVGSSTSSDSSLSSCTRSASGGAAVPAIDVTGGDGLGFSLRAKADDGDCVIYPIRTVILC